MITFANRTFLIHLLRIFRNFDQASSVLSIFAFLRRRFLSLINFLTSLCIQGGTLGRIVTILFGTDSDAASKITEMMFSVTNSMSSSSMPFQLA